MDEAATNCFRPVTNCVARVLAFSTDVVTSKSWLKVERSFVQDNALYELRMFDTVHPQRSCRFHAMPREGLPPPLQPDDAAIITVETYMDFL